MSGPSAAWALPLDERPPAYQPERPAAFPPDTLQQPAPGEAQATTSGVLGAPTRGGPSVAAIGSHVRLLGLEFVELAASAKLLSENVSAIVMRKPLADFILQIDALKAGAMDLQRSINRKVPRP